jgi:hypothetical protein
MYAFLDHRAFLMLNMVLELHEALLAYIGNTMTADRGLFCISIQHCLSVNEYYV